MSSPVSLAVNKADLSVYLVTDQGLCLGRDLLEVTAAAVAGGATVVQIREKQADTRDFVALARAMKRLLAGRGVPLVINDRVDLALAVDADGVHVGQSDMHPADVRALIGPDKLLGLSVDTMANLEEAQGLPVDYLGLGPIFPTPTKTDTSEPWGLEGLARGVRASGLPVVAIGGVGAANAAEVAAQGPAGLAVVSAICSAEDPRQAAAALRKIMEEAARA